MAIKIFVGRELFPWSLFWEDGTRAADGTPNVQDFSGGGYTFVVTVRQLVNDVETNTTITATVTANATPTYDRKLSTDIPSLTVAPAAGQLDGLVAGKAWIHVVATATSGGKDGEQEWEALVAT